MRLREGQRLVQDGPYADTKEQLGGYFVIEAPDLDTALAWAARCPSAAYTSVGAEVGAAVEQVARSSYGRLVAYLASVSGDIASAEDALGDAMLAALRTCPERGVPERPDSWSVTAARRTIIDAARRQEVARRAVPAVARALAERAEAPFAGVVADDRLRLMFACAHPAIDPAVPGAGPPRASGPSRGRPDAVYAAYGTAWNDVDLLDPARTP